MNFKQAKLDNGLSIIGEVNPAAQSVAVGFFVRSGARDETMQINGVSHFLEHMLFKGTNEISALEVNERFDATGAKFNAFTSEENTVYYAAILPEYLHEVAQLWCKLLRPALREEDFNMEKNVIKEEIAMYQDLPQFDVMDRCRHLYFADHPCAKSVLGTVESIDGLTAAQMREYFQHRYAPNNITLACAGNFDFDALVELARQNCGFWQPYAVGRDISDWKGGSQARRLEKSSIQREHICLMSPAVSAQDSRNYAATLLAGMIGDSVGSLYFWDLIDTAIAETAVMQHDAMDGVGAFYTYLTCNPAAADLAMSKIEAVLNNLPDRLGHEELEKAKNKVLSAVTLKNERPMGRLLDLGFDWTYLHQYVPVADEVKLIREVSMAQIMQLVEELAPQKFTRYSLGPHLA